MKIDTSSMKGGRSVKLGLENKGGVRALAVLGVVLAGAIYYSFFPDSTPSAPGKARVGARSDPAPSEEASAAHSAAGRGRTDEFLPVLHRKKAHYLRHVLKMRDLFWLPTLDAFRTLAA